MPNNPDRARRRELQARDDGDPDDTVIKTLARTSNSKAYHEDPDCRQLSAARSTTTLTRGEAWAEDRYPCSVCVLEADSRGEGGVHWARLSHRLRSDDVQSVSEAQAALEEEGSA
ncbi:MAG: hypothetical protein ACOCUA_03215 [archaeon]